MKINMTEGTRIIPGCEKATKPALSEKGGTTPAWRKMFELGFFLGTVLIVGLGAVGGLR